MRREVLLTLRAIRGGLPGLLLLVLWVAVALMLGDR
jgi:hypothetical protein